MDSSAVNSGAAEPLTFSMQITSTHTHTHTTQLLIY